MFGNLILIVTLSGSEGSHMAQDKTERLKNLTQGELSDQRIPSYPSTTEITTSSFYGRTPRNDTLCSLLAKRGNLIPSSIAEQTNCHCQHFTFCHSERSEESHMAQDKTPRLKNLVDLAPTL